MEGCNQLVSKKAMQQVAMSKIGKDTTTVYQGGQQMIKIQAKQKVKKSRNKIILTTSFWEYSIRKSIFKLCISSLYRS